VIRAVKGTRDILPPASGLWNFVEARAREIFRRFNYHEIRTPILEETALFARGVGEDTDIVSKEMYTFEDRDGASLTLRPECTASVLRAYIEHRLDQQPGLVKLYYIGPMFRRERPQKGRFRQFHQIGAEAIGSTSPALDVEVIELAAAILQSVGLEGFSLILNSVGCPRCRPGFLALLRESLREIAPRLCRDCQQRAVTNPLRVLDCKVEADQPLIDGLPSILDHLCDECRSHFAAVQQGLADAALPFEVRPRLVRGLDYYTRTTFEITHGALGAQNSVLGGGRYDGLAEMLGSKVRAPGIGFSIGEDRLILSLEQSARRPAASTLDVFVAPLGEAAARQAAAIARHLRRNGFSVEVGLDARLKRSLELAHKLGARYALILGDEELAAGTLQLKEMQTGRQRALTRDQLIEELSLTKVEHAN
jgi:histidyl-tRNA synthetase